jgi:3-phenylpropionate/trans-cinnamate dioxygenase ferredoxin component
MNMCARPISVDEARDKPAEPSGWTPACALERLIDQGMVCARIEGAELILIWSEARAVACERACPHEQADLSRGHLSAGRLVCPHHAASFDLEDGSISSGWASRPLRIYPVRVEQGQVWVKADA